jgi:membrane protease YdiL (CAAX protease family)
LEPAKPASLRGDQRDEHSIPGASLPAAGSPFVTTPLASTVTSQREINFLEWTFLNTDGLRAGWSLALFLVLYYLFSFPAGILVLSIFGNINPRDFNPMTGIGNEVIQLLPLLGAWAVMARIEQRRISAYYLDRNRSLAYGAVGIASGFASLSLLIGGLFWGHWIKFGSPALSGAAVLGFGAVWAVVFLMTGLFEEGGFRCYLQFTLTRGFGGGGVGFWCAAALISVCFGAVHLSNSDESLTGILCAVAVGFVFCVSIRLTGSAWWAIGFHAAWDWAETFFYGTPDSGIVPQGHWLTTTPVGNALWSGGTTGPEGSLLFLPVSAGVVLLLFALYGRRGLGGADRGLSGPVVDRFRDQAAG